MKWPELVILAVLLHGSIAHAQEACEVVFQLSSAVTVGSIQWRTDYSAADGFFDADNDDVRCEKLILSGPLYSFRDYPEKRLLISGMLDTYGVDGPVDMSACTFVAQSSPDLSDFQISVTGAADPDLLELEPLPTVTVSKLSCEPVICGNGEVGPGEECDDENQSDEDDCLTNCHFAVCGDAHTKTGDEECDDGNSSNDDDCLNTCVAAACGDGYLQTGVEACDDGNQQNSDGCLDTCVVAQCGDGFIRQPVEECDDGNLLPADGCTPTCTRAWLCGDATDDGAVLAGDALRVLQRSVGIDTLCPTWICDVDYSGLVSTTDALRVLRRSVNDNTVLTCGEPTAIKFRLLTPSNLGALQLAVDLVNVEGELVGVGDKVECTVAQMGVGAAFHYNKEERALSASFASLSGIRGPGTLAQCELSPTGDIRSQHFVTSVLDAQTVEGTNAPRPAVRIYPD